MNSSVLEVCDHYRDALARGGWTVDDTKWYQGEWVYTVSSGARRGAVEIEHRNGVTEIEVELSEPAEPESPSPLVESEQPEPSDG